MAEGEPGKAGFNVPVTVFEIFIRGRKMLLLKDSLRQQTTIWRKLNLKQFLKRRLSTGKFGSILEEPLRVPFKIYERALAPSARTRPVRKAGPQGGGGAWRNSHPVRRLKSHVCADPRSKADALGTREGACHVRCERGEAVEVLGESRDRGSRTAAGARAPGRGPHTAGSGHCGEGRSRIMMRGSRHEKREQRNETDTVLT